jgi:hypothetical protein
MEQAVVESEGDRSVVAWRMRLGCAKGRVGDQATQPTWCFPLLYFLFFLFFLVVVGAVARIFGGLLVAWLELGRWVVSFTSLFFKCILKQINLPIVNIK